MKTKTRSKAPSNKRRLTDALLRNLKGKKETYLIWDDRQSGFGIAVTPKGTISFKCTYYVKTRLRWFTLDKYPAISLKDARELAQKIRAMAVLGEDAMAEKRTRESLKRYGDKFQDVAENYVERYAKRENKSWRQADNLMKRYVLPELGSHPIKEITKRDIKNLFNRLTIDKDRPVLANQVLAAIGAVLRWAVDEELIKESPALKIKRNKVKAETRFLTDAEVALMWLLMDQPLRMILITAQRPGEVANMRWEDIDLNEKLWTLPGEPKPGWPGTKNARTHEVPLSEQAISILNELEPQEKGPVFDGKIPTTLPIWRELGLEKFRPHHLRATASTGMDELEIHPKHISRVLNHTIPGVTESYIRHSHREQKRRALEAWGNHLQTILEGPPAKSTVVPFRTAR